jgi:hypothetical protein
MKVVKIPLHPLIKEIYWVTTPDIGHNMTTYYHIYYYDSKYALLDEIWHSEFKLLTVLTHLELSFPL